MKPNKWMVAFFNISRQLDHEGNLVSSYIVRNSGSFALDQEMPAMLVHAQPIPRLSQKSSPSSFWGASPRLQFLANRRFGKPDIAEGHREGALLTHFGHSIRV
jgi:hypothetical protein